MFSNENPPKGGFITLSWLVTLSNNKHMSFETVRREYYNVYFYRVNNNPVILFDGVCNLCTGSVQFILKRDKEKKFLFASLQSSYGQDLLKQLDLPTDTFNSFILYDGGKIFTRSTAALKMFSQLKGWRWVKIFWIVPKFIRDAVYNLIAKNRYRWFGKKEECWLPTPELKARFLD
jgi:predicted DCC family thiol-disulfide oxidoreductase YuxK